MGHHNCLTDRIPDPWAMAAGFLLSQGVVVLPRYDSDLGTSFTSEFLMNCAYMVPPVALGYIGSFVLRIKKRGEQ